ncbi:MAG TPA: methyltransferase domain-containing protein [Thermomicrobiales bacterium]|nr:methyltransferase domain-containing protein [Thermomicrobiales bacterium]
MTPETSRAQSVDVGSRRWQPETIAQEHAAASGYLDNVAATSFLRAIAARTMEALALAPGETVLEVGCGTGVFLPLLGHTVGPTGRVVGLDHAPTFVAEARARVAAQGLDGHVTVEEGDAYRLPFPDASFDAAHCERVLMHLADPTAALREMRRVVRPGGRVVAVETDSGSLRTDHPDREAHDLLKARVLSRVRQPDMGLTLWRRFAEAGLTDREAVPIVGPITDVALVRQIGVDLRSAAEELVAAGQLGRERADAALAYLDTASRDGEFFFYLALVLAFGRVPES